MNSKTICVLFLAIFAIGSTNGGILDPILAIINPLLNPLLSNSVLYPYATCPTNGGDADCLSACSNIANPTGTPQPSCSTQSISGNVYRSICNCRRPADPNVDLANNKCKVEITPACTVACNSVSTGSTAFGCTGASSNKYCTCFPLSVGENPVPETDPLLYPYAICPTDGGDADCVAACGGANPAGKPQPSCSTQSIAGIYRSICNCRRASDIPADTASRCKLETSALCQTACNGVSTGSTGLACNGAGSPPNKYCTCYPLV